MAPNNRKWRAIESQDGFSLIEMAVVLVVVSFLLGGLLVPLSTQIDQRNREQTDRQLAEIKDALLGYAVTYGYLPCPFIPNATTANPANAGYGVANATCNTASVVEGILPWKTLGLNTGYDAWGHSRSTAADSWLGFFRYAVDKNFSNTAAPFTLTTATSTPSISVVDSSGKPLTSAAEPPVAVIYSTGPDDADDDPKGLRADGANEANDPDNPTPTASTTFSGGTPSSNFDDMTIWISRPVLYNRMVSAGKLP